MRLPRIAVAVTAVLLMTGIIGVATAGGIFEGVVVAAGNASLTVTDIYGQNAHSRMVGHNARIIKDGTPAKLEELQMGDRVILTTRRLDRRNEVVVRIDAHSVN